MRDRDIRSALKQELRAVFSNEPGTIIIDEVGLCGGSARIDVAVLNGAINGYEIKSESDTLDRLPGQQEIYSKTLDTVTVISSGSHIKKIKKQIPDWWGMMEVSRDCDGLSFRVIREPVSNPNIDPYSLVQLLWREEALSILKDRSLEKGVLTKPRKDIWERIVENLTLEELRRVIGEKLKSRENWRSVRSRKKDGG